jgi:hypothetical protein
MGYRSNPYLSVRNAPRLAPASAPARRTLARPQTSRRTRPPGPPVNRANPYSGLL